VSLGLSRERTALIGEKDKKEMLFDGNVLFLLFMIAILTETLSCKKSEKTSTEIFFARIVMIYTGTLLLSIARKIVILFLSNESVLFIINTMYIFSFPLMLFLWLHFEINILGLPKTLGRMIIVIGILPLTMFLSLAILNICSKDFLYFNPDFTLAPSFGKTLFFAICFVYSLTTFILEFTHHTQLVHSNFRLLSILPFLIFISTLVFFFTGQSQFLTAAISVTILVTFVVLKGWANTFDRVTGLPHRQPFISDLSKALNHNEKGCILITDIVNFKYFNKKFGQEKGNALLRKIGEYLGETYPKCQVYRINGDQFAIITKNVTLEQAYTFATIIIERFSSVWDLGNLAVPVDIRLLLVVFPDQVAAIDQAINAIDYALAIAKTKSNSITVYSHEMLLERQRNQEVAEALKRSIDNSQFYLLYQPVFSSQTGAIVSAEALLRIHDPILGELQPAEFIPIAEQSGMIEQITYWIIQQVCDMLKEMDPGQETLKNIAINLSTIHFLTPNMKDQILDIILKSGVPSSLISFEITESLVINSFDKVEKVMHYLSKNGINFSLDDYGTGYSNIEYLMELPFNTVKLDSSIVKRYDTHYILLSSVVLMLHRIGMEIIAEGVETEQQFQVLKDIGIDKIQGFLFSRPLAKDQFLHLMATKASTDAP
jgi:diguanylate cyclase (GGDEF)-like protein